MNIAVRTDDRFVKVDGRSIRYLEEGGGVPMFSPEMLSQMIRFYGSAQQTIMGQ